MNTEQSPPKKRGCFFYGCLSCIILSLVVVLVGYLGMRAFRNWLLGFTDTKPILIESVEVSPAQLEALKERIAAFMQAVQDGKNSQELRLTADDLNALIATEPSVKELKNKLFVMIDDNRIQGKVSWPLDRIKVLDKIKVLRLKGRYLNGLATFKASLENGRLRVTLDGLEVNGKPIPEKMLVELKRQNLAQNVEDDPKNAEALQKFEGIRIQNGAVILKNKIKE